MNEQQQFLQVVGRDEAKRRFHEAIRLDQCGEESVPLAEALGRVLAQDVIAAVDVPSFDRSNYDGFAVQAADTHGATEESPRTLRLMRESIATGGVPDVDIVPGTAVSIATGGMLPRGADAVVLVEHTDCATAAETAELCSSVVSADVDDASADTAELFVHKGVAAGHGVTFAGTDMAAGETVLRVGDLLTSRETGVLAAIGVCEVTVYRRPRVAIFSTGHEIISPGEPMHAGKVYDSNARILADTAAELGGEPLELGIVRDDAELLRGRLKTALEEADVVLLSGGTSKGHGDLCYRIVAELTEPGIVAHGVALKPGKPICLASHHGKPVVVLPGFPTSAIFTFHEFVAPVIRRLGGRREDERASASATLAVKVNSEIGRTEYLLVGLIEGASAAANTPLEDSGRATLVSDGSGPPPDPLPHPGGRGVREGGGVGMIAFPMGKGSGSVTAFSRADGFITIDRFTEIVDAGTHVEVTLLARDLQPADLVVIGSHCIGLDYLLGELQRRGWRTKFLAVGSTAGLEAARRGECDVAGVHLLDTKTGEYNRPFLDDSLAFVGGYRRRQGIVYRADDARFEGRPPQEAIAAARSDPACVMINRNQGSGTRILIDRLLAEAVDDKMPQGYAVQARNHNAVAAAIRQGRADWGVAIETVLRAAQDVAGSASLSFLPLLDEHYDFVISKSRAERPAVRAFTQLLEESATRERLTRLGFTIGEPVNC